MDDTSRVNKCKFWMEVKPEGRRQAGKIKKIEKV